MDEEKIQNIKNKEKCQRFTVSVRKKIEIIRRNKKKEKKKKRKKLREEN